MEPRETMLAHLERLGNVLKQRGFTTELVIKPAKPYLQVANADTPTLNERVVCHRDSDTSWAYWWPWKQPIGSVDDIESVVDKIAAVLKSVEGA